MTAVVGDAVGSSRLRDGPVDHGLLVLVGGVGDQSVGGREIVGRERPVAAHLISLGLPPHRVAGVAPGETVATEELTELA